MVTLPEVTKEEDGKNDYLEHIKNTVNSTFKKQKSPSQQLPARNSTTSMRQKAILPIKKLSPGR
ncbi:hypothetical protein KIN20_005299, partial [Parelaphostrongylus tenuis]